MSDPELAKADEKLRKISASEEKRQLARMREKALLDWNSLQVDAREEGRQEGLAEGQQLGIEQGKQLGIEQGKQLGIEQGKQLGIEQGKQLGIEQGKQLGIEQGRHEGIREAQIHYLRHLRVSRRYSAQELHDLTQAPLELIEELLKQSLHPPKDRS
jgi:flagellar biosynthesis/type III secretory pathway protein FliH